MTGAVWFGALGALAAFAALPSWYVLACWLSAYLWAVLSA